MSSSSSSKVATKDVFIVSGGDMRYSFVSHLSAAFRRKNISVTEEDDSSPLESSEYLSKKTQSAIKRSKVCVVVLSQEFALSKSSLSMLVEVLDQQHGALVPVFYRVDRLVVEQQSEKFGEAFSDHSMSSVPEDRVMEWRNALKETAHLKEAIESKDGQSDLELVEEIVTYVHERLFPTDKIGIDSRLMEIENLIRKQPCGIRNIGIWGMAGIGKTTIAEAVFSHMKWNFKSPRLIRKFEERFQKKGLYQSREKWLPAVLKDKLDINKSIDNTSQQEMIVLLVLDDVRNPINAESFLGGFDWFDPGSVIIITSRDKHVLHQCRVSEIYEAKKLEDKEALKLFSGHAFGEIVREEDPRRLVSEMVVKYANGNAKALSYYGNNLKGKTPEEMKAAFFKLKQCPPPDILEMFKSSYDELSDNEKNIFLDIACFFIGKSVERVIQALDGRGLFVKIGIQYLFEKSLVTIHENKVEMQELVRDVAYEILNQEVKNRNKGNRLCGAHHIQPLLEDEGTKLSSEPSLVLEKIESILLDVSGLSFVVDPVAFQNMCNLRLLKIYYSDPEQQPGLDLSKGLVSLPFELQFLYWENYNMQTLPDDFNPHKLVELNMPYSQLQKLWEGGRRLKSLKTISLQHSKKLVEINQLSEAPNLEVIDLRGCTSLQSFETTGSLEHLQVLNLCGCVEVKSFPGLLPPNIKELNLNGTGIREIPASIEALSKLVKLDLGNCRELLNFMIKIYNMEVLELLNLSGCIGLKSFPEIEKEMGNLQYLYLSCTGIQELHTSISNMIGLKVLKVNRTLNLPESLKDLKDLKVEYDEEIENPR